MHKQFIKMLAFVLAASLLGACASAASPSMSAGEGVSYYEEAPMEADFDEAGRNSLNSSIPPQDVERVIIRTADMTLVVDNPPDSMERIKKLAEEYGGFVVTANLRQQTLGDGTVVPYANVTIRVPAEKLEDVIAEIRAESSELPLSENISSQDVTDHYVDLQSRLRNLEAAETKLAEIMEDAKDTEDVLSVYNELVRVREEIEVIKGQIKFYEESAALSSVSVELVANEAVQPLTIGGWQPVGVVKNALQALINFFKGFINFLIYLVLVVIPVLLVIGLVFVLPVVLIIRAIRKRRKANQSSDPEPASTAGEGR